MVVTPFETVLEGEFDELMRILKEALEVAGQEADNVFANVKINVGEILSIVPYAGITPDQVRSKFNTSSQTVHRLPYIIWT